MVLGLDLLGTHWRVEDAQALCHMASENTVAVKREAGMEKKEE